MGRVALAAAVSLLILASGAQAAAVPPSVTGEAVGAISSTDATLEASIDAGSATAGAYYQFQFSEFPTEFPDELNCPPPPESGPYLPCAGPESSGALPIGHIPSGDGAASASLDLATAGVTLEPGKTYYFRVVAASAVQSEDTIEWEDPVVAGEERAFTTSSPSAPPKITGESVSQISSTGATLEASLDSGGPAYYQFQFSAFPTEFPDELNCPPPPVLGLPACVGPQDGAALPIGYVGSGASHVSLNLADAGIKLDPGATYYFRVVAAAAKQTEDSVEWEQPVATGKVQAFTAASDPGEAAQQPPSGGGGTVAPSTDPPGTRRHRRHRHHHVSHRRGGAIARASIAK